MESLKRALAGGEEAPQVDADTDRVEGEGGTTPLGLEAPPPHPPPPPTPPPSLVVLRAASGPGTDESSDGRGRRPSPARGRQSAAGSR